MINRMSKESLEAKKAEVTKEFDDLENQKQEIIKRQFELRGSYQVYEKEIAELDIATTVVAKPKKEGKDAK